MIIFKRLQNCKLIVSYVLCMQMFQALECQSLWHNRPDAAVLGSAPEALAVIRKPTGEPSASKECNSISSDLYSFAGCMGRGKFQETLPRKQDVQ